MFFLGLQKVVSSLSKKNKNGDNAQTINKDATQLFEQFEIRLSEKDKIIEEQKNFIKTLLEKLPII